MSDEPPAPRLAYRPVKCRRCGNRTDPANGFTGIHICRGRTALEQLQTGRVFYLCDECTDSLETWLLALTRPPGM